MRPGRAPARHGRCSPAGSAPRSCPRRTPRDARRTPTRGGQLHPPPRAGRAPPPRSPQGRTDTRPNVPREPLPSDSETGSGLYDSAARNATFSGHTAAAVLRRLTIALALALAVLAPAALATPAARAAA